MKPKMGASSGLAIKADDACIKLGAKSDVTICRSGPNEVDISGDLIVNGYSLSDLMDRFSKLEKMMS